MSSSRTVRDLLSPSLPRSAKLRLLAGAALATTLVVGTPVQLTPAHASVAATAAHSSQSSASAHAATARAVAARAAAAARAGARAAARARTPTRLKALAWAERQRGKWYCYGGTGPKCYDCSGLVMEAYKRAGINLPRTTYEMLDSRHLRRIPARDRKPGDLAFYGSGHVELVTPHYTFGALHTGTRIGYHRPSRWWHPTMYFEVV